jgi:hypothetical protein
MAFWIQGNAIFIRLFQPPYKSQVSIMLLPDKIVMAREVGEESDCSQVKLDAITDSIVLQCELILERSFALSFE